MSVEIFNDIQIFLTLKISLIILIWENQPHPINKSNPMSPSMGISDYLVAFSTQSQGLCVACVDMQNSTKISANLPSYKLSKYYEVFLNSMSKIIGKFGGKVIKNVGDCLLYYFQTRKIRKKIFFRDVLIVVWQCVMQIRLFLIILVSQNLPTIIIVLVLIMDM